MAASNVPTSAHTSIPTCGKTPCRGFRVRKSTGCRDRRAAERVARETVRIAELELFRALTAYRPPGASLSDPLFPSTLFPILRTFKCDLKEAGIPFKDERSRQVDFHALRMTFLSSLAQKDVHPKKAQALARHAKIETTMQIYTDLGLLDLRAAVEYRVPNRVKVHQDSDRSVPGTSLSKL